MIHRDLKPQNIMRRKSDEKIMLIDFGAVKEIKGLTVLSGGHTTTTIPVGTPGYMPSEQATGKPKFCSDIYAVGIIGIEALSGVRASQFQQDPSTGEILCKNQVNVSEQLGRILDKMVLYDYRYRYQCIDDVMAELKGLSSNPPLQQPQPQSSTDVPLVSAKRVDYTKLRDLLAAGKWIEANQETEDCMLKVAGRKKKGFLNIDNIEKFPDADLRTIDQLWVKYSNGRFGFTVQKQIYLDCGAKPNGKYPGDEIWYKFCEQVGWGTRVGMLQEFEYKTYGECIFNTSAPAGHLPFSSLIKVQKYNSRGRGGDFDDFLGKLSRDAEVKKILTLFYRATTFSYTGNRL